MDSCKMAHHTLKTSSPDKVNCENGETCDKIVVDISSAGSICYSLQAVGGPHNYKTSGQRCFRICDPKSIKSSEAISKI
jgi:hypothetical protein